jgi:hypothetical protein
MVYSYKDLVPAARREKFLDKCIPEPNSGCWLWMGTLFASGYGECYAFGKREVASRAAYREFVCDIPDGLFVRHTCDNRICVNPDHLLVGTQMQNVQDMVDRNRQARGERGGNVRLTESQVRAILATPLSQRKTAKQYGISQAHVSLIRRRKIWKHLDLNEGIAHGQHADESRGVPKTRYWR